MISIVLSRLELFHVSLSLVWYVFLLLLMFTFTCSGVRGSLVVVFCLFFPIFFVLNFAFLSFVRLPLKFLDHAYLLWAISLLLDFFSVKESAEGFLYIAKRSSAKMIILDLPSSQKHWKDWYFFVGGCNWEYNPTDREDTLGIPTAWTAPENLRELPFTFNWV